MTPDEQLLDDIRNEYREEYMNPTLCDDCGPMVMCRYHSLLSLIFRGTVTTAAIQRSYAKSLE